MFTLEQLPLSQDKLDQFRFAAQRKNRPSLVGGNVGRRKGQSLEFREFAPYQFGDDLRHVDWYASARYGGRDDWLVRRFVAEEHFKLVISLDTRPTMTLPEPINKLQVAFWLTEALTRIALPAEHFVVWHRLFGRAAAQELRGSRELKRVRQAVRRFATTPEEGRQLNLEAIERHLPPTAVWLIITDLYFDWDREAEKLAQRMREAQDGLRWVILLELDSWPLERNQLGLGPRELEGADFPLEENQLWIGENLLAEVDSRIKHHRHRFLEAVIPGGCDIIHWPWPSTSPYTSQTFVRQFGEDKSLQRLFMRDK
jgi:hypothetical protein